MQYPKFSLSWVASEEPAARALIPRVIEDLRFRLAYGGSGQQPGVNTALRTLSPVAGPESATVLTPGTFGNENLKPEHVMGLELGFEAGLWKDRIGVDFTYYNDLSHDAILSEIIKLSDAKNDTMIVIGTAPPVTHKIGYPPFDLFTYEIVSATYDPATRKATNPKCADGRGGVMDCFIPGTTSVQAPLLYMGHSIPTTEGSVGNSSRYKMFRLHVLADFQTGFRKLDNNLRIRCQLNATCPEAVWPEKYDPAVVAVVVFAVRHGAHARREGAEQRSGDRVRQPCQCRAHGEQRHRRLRVRVGRLRRRHRHPVG
ncbi:MAG: hypothetical protein C0497_12040 [Gemmatimonas sp.]|nr:hypothetical protein [Gemmatimonas sp.]